MAGPQLIVEVDDRQVMRTFRRFNSILPEQLRLSLISAMELIGQHSVSSYMQRKEVVDMEFGKIPKIALRSPGEKLGIRTTRLMRSITGKEGPRGAEYIRRILMDGVDVVAEMGSKVPYAAIHEKGGATKRGGRMRARPYLEPAAKDKETEIYTEMKIRLELLIRNVEKT